MKKGNDGSRRKVEVGLVNHPTYDMTKLLSCMRWVSVQDSKGREVFCNYYAEIPDPEWAIRLTPEQKAAAADEARTLLLKEVTA